MGSSPRAKCPRDRSSPEGALNLSRLDDAISRAAERLISLQREDGSWPGQNLAGPQFTALWLIAKRHFGTLDAEDEEAMTAWMLRQQREDGGFAASSPMAHSDLPASLAVRFALTPRQRRGVSSKRLDEYISSRGGIEAADPVTLTFGCIAGHVDPRILGRWSLLSRLIPGIDRVMGARFSAAVNLTAVGLPCVVQSLQAGHPLGPGFHPIKKIEWRRALEYLSDHQNPAGNWRGVLTSTLIGTLALEALGVERIDPRLANAIEYLDHFKAVDPSTGDVRAMPFTSEVWNTAVAVRTLLELKHLQAGPDERDRSIHRGIDYLLSQQSEGVPRDWVNLPRPEPCDGGWAYEADDPRGSDCDTTAAVVDTLHQARVAGLRTDLDQPIARGVGFLDAMQNASGGWPAFTHGLRQKPPGPAFTKPISIQRPGLLSALRNVLRPPLELGDSAWADLTGRVVRVYATLGRTLDDARVSRAVSFLRTQLADQPGWWGRWEVNYLMASAYVLSGLARARYDVEQGWVQSVGAWIEDCQNEDGGWGESVETYVDPLVAGEGPSAPGITAGVLLGLLDMDGAGDVPVGRGIEYLLSTREPDGTWGPQPPSGVMLPPDQFYVNEVYTECICAAAFIRYRARVGHGDRSRSD